MLTISQIDIDPRINKVARSLAANGCEVDIFCFDHAPEAVVTEEEVSPGCRYVRIPLENRLGGVWLFYQEDFLRQGLDRHYDCVHANDLTTLLLGWILAQRKGLPLVYDAHEMWCENVSYNGEEWVPMPWPVRVVAGLYERFLVRRVDVFFTVSQTIVNEFTRRYRLRQPPLLVANFPEVSMADVEPTESIRELCSLSSDHFVTLYLGGVNPLRNIENVVRAHRFLPSPCVLVIRGPGVEYYGREYVALAAELGLEGRVLCLPPVEMGEVIAGAYGADCGVVMLKNLCKNFYWFYPNKFFEYMLAGLPVGVSDFPDVSAHIRREQCGVVFDPESPESIAEALIMLYNDREEAVRMGQRGKEGVMTKYNWQAATGVLLAGYESIFPDINEAASRAITAPR